MGCDIHAIIERKWRGRWVGISELKDTKRYYPRFTALANVRGYGGLDPRGVPPDASDTTQYHIENWGTDGHSHSWLSLELAFQIFKEHRMINGNPEHDVYTEFDAFGLEELDYSDFRIIFWFDN